MLQKDPSIRLGHNGAEEVKKHQFFSDVNFDNLYHKKYEALNIPKLSTNQGLNNFDKEFTTKSINSFDVQK